MRIINTKTRHYFQTYIEPYPLCAINNLIDYVINENKFQLFVVGAENGTPS